MAIIFGITESLKSLKSKLNNNGIYRFSSVKQIKDFLSNYNTEKRTILKNKSDKLDGEYSNISFNLKHLIKKRDVIINTETNRIDNKVSELQQKIDIINNRNVNFLKKIFLKIKLFSFKNQLNQLVSSKKSSIDSLLKDVNKSIENDEIFIKTYNKDKENLIKKRAKIQLEKLEYIHNFLESSRNLISGAIGENLVVKEIKKLGDDYILINDFNLNFSRPIFYKKHNERIRSVQIDHLLISRAGIFIIETKNWSKLSVNTNNLRSPIKQIERANFALYIYVSDNVSLNEHHWGEQTIPIRNLIVMINNKPTGKFKYVAVKLLKELNDYLKYFEPVLNQSELDKVVRQLTN
ncbi:NERD domain-containing protein [Flavobacteriaceae bacterium]|nr:NERD domain-containing protein [Flavobacteriaceae bacterium]